MRLDVGIALVAAGCGRVDFAPNDDAGPVDDAIAHAAIVYAISQNPATSRSQVLQLDPATGELLSMFDFTGFGTLGGLAYWDANTLYASGNQAIVRITLSPPAEAMVQTFAGNIASLERDGERLLGITDAGNVVTFAPGGTMTSVPLRDATSASISVDGGDLAQLSDGRWLWWSNVLNQLFQLDVSAGRVTPIGAPNQAVPYVSGLIHDDAGRLFVTSGVTDELLELEPTSAAVLDRKPLCMPCPTPYDLDSGDMTRGP